MLNAEKRERENSSSNCAFTNFCVPRLKTSYVLNLRKFFHLFVEFDGCFSKKKGRGIGLSALIRSFMKGLQRLVQDFLRLVLFTASFVSALAELRNRFTPAI